MKLPIPIPLSRRPAFTLIELLAVIAIIGVIAGLIVQLAPAVNQNKKRQRVEAEKQKLILFIDSYQSKFGHYPPDNGALAGHPPPSGPLSSYKLPLDPAQYDTATQLNPLLYELTGGTNNYNNSGNYYAFNGSNFLQSCFTTAYGAYGILNADAEQQVVFKPLPQPNACMNYPNWMAGAVNTNLQGLVVPVEMIQMDDPLNPGGTNYANITNFWHYDASSTNRHNINSYDLWAEFVVGKKDRVWLFVTNGNW